MLNKHYSIFAHFSLTMTLFVLKCKAAYLLTSFPLSEGLVSVKHIKIIMQSLLTQEQRYCSIILTEQQHPILFINPISHNVLSAAWSF